MIKESFKKYLEEAIGEEKSLIAFSAFEQAASVSVRLNPFKKSRDFQGEAVAWNEYGRLLPERPVFTLDPHFHSGAYYVQDSSSMFVGEVFRRVLKQGWNKERPIRVLDLCAAPGGKTTDIAASLRKVFGDRFILVANEVMKQRASVLATNVALWGDPNIVVTSDDPKAFSRFKGYFDIIVADVPCSGEGMFRKDEQAQEQWSEDNVALCQARQKRIIADVWPALAESGALIYSTCTFNIYENDENAQWIVDELSAEFIFSEDEFSEYEGVIPTKRGFSLVPGFVPGEGQYCTAIRKYSFLNMEYNLRRPKAPKKVMFNEFPSETYFNTPIEFRQKGETIIAVPKLIYQDVQHLESDLHVLSAGCAAGVMKHRDFIPDADLALSIILNEDAFVSVEVDKDTALAFLHKDSIVLKGVPTGYVLLKFEGNPIGFVKNLVNRCNNLHPQSRRIRMDI